jgi:hypothetical protein
MDFKRKASEATCLWSGYAHVRLANPNHLLHGAETSPLLRDRRTQGQVVGDDLAQPRGQAECVLLEIASNHM